MTEQERAMALEKTLQELEENVNQLNLILAKIESEDDKKENIVLKTQYDNARYLLRREMEMLKFIRQKMKKA